MESRVPQKRVETTASGQWHAQRNTFSSILFDIVKLIALILLRLVHNASAFMTNLAAFATGAQMVANRSGMGQDYTPLFGMDLDAYCTKLGIKREEDYFTTSRGLKIFYRGWTQGWSANQPSILTRRVVVT